MANRRSDGPPGRSLPTRRDPDDDRGDREAGGRPEAPASRVRERRLERLRRRLDGADVDALLVHAPPDVRYLIGFTGTAGWLVVADDAAWFLADGRYREQARRQVHGAELLPFEESLRASLASFVQTREWGRIGVDPECTTMELRARLTDALPGVEWSPAAEARRLRRTKEECEIEAIRAALGVVEEVLAGVTSRIEPGMTERQVAAELEYGCRLRGADGMSFDTIVASGPRSALPHGLAGDRRLCRDEPVLVDFGCRLEGYCSDLTRWLWLGDEVPEPWLRRHRAVVQAQLVARRAILSGALAREVDGVARRTIEEAGHDGVFAHGLGHGLGLEVHEAPSLASRSDDVLEAGMVVTVEPGIYVEGEGGIRIEDVVVVGESGCERLTTLPHDPILC